MVSLRFEHPIPQSHKTVDGYVLSWEAPALMGILNVTPDSFSDGGRYTDFQAATQQAEQMLAAGALMIDIGGESTRPYAEPVSIADEIDRVLPVIRYLSEHTQAIISIDTMKAEVAEAAFKAGAHLLNDVTGLRDPSMLALCVSMARPAIIMHMQGMPRDMQEAPHYDDVLKDVSSFLAQQASHALSQGIPGLMLDPGFGFGKTLAHNLELLGRIDELVALTYPVLLGASRKRSIAMMSGECEPDRRDPGSIVLHLEGVKRGVAMLRVHNVAAHQQAVSVWKYFHGKER